MELVEWIDGPPSIDSTLSGMAEHLSRSNVTNYTYVFLCPVDYFLVYRPSEGLVSVVNKEDVIEPSESALFMPCKVKTTRKVYSGITADKGMCLSYMNVYTRQ